MTPGAASSCQNSAEDRAPALHKGESLTCPSSVKRAGSVVLLFSPAAQTLQEQGDLAWQGNEVPLDLFTGLLQLPG